MVIKIITLLLCYLLILKKESYGLLAYIFFWIFISLDGTPGNDAIADFGAWINQFLIIILFFHCFLLKNRRFKLNNVTKLFFTLVLIFFFYIVSNHYFFSIDKDYSYLTIVRILKFTILTITVPLCIRTKYDIKLISYALLYMVVIQCLLDINIKYNYPTTDASVWIDNITKAFFIAFIILSLMNDKISIFKKIFILLGLFIFMIYVFETSTRRQFLLFPSIFLAIIFFYNFEKRQKYNLLLVLSLFFILGFIIYSFNPEGMDHRIEQSSNMFDFQDDQRNRGWSGRIVLWDSAIKMFLSNPLFGSGIGVSWLFLDDIAYESSGIVLHNSRAHNLILKSLAEIGIIGTIIFFYIWYLIIKILFICYKGFILYDKKISTVSFSLFCALIAMIPFSIFGWAGYLNKPIWFFSGITISLVNIYYNNFKNKLI